MVNRLLNLIENGELQIRIDTLKRLLSRILNAANIPFHGEPAIGMQVMGVLLSPAVSLPSSLTISVRLLV